MRIATPIRILLLLVLLAAVPSGLRYLQNQVDMMTQTRLGGFLFRFLTTPYFNLGDFAVTPAFLLQAVLYLLLLGLLSGAVRRFLRDRLLKHTSLDEGQRYAAARVTGYAVFLLGLLIGLNTAGVNLNSLLLVGGAVGIGIGFGLQSIANNFISGIIILLERPIKVGDRVEVGGLNGDVVRIGARSTWVRTNDNVVVIVPNSEFVSDRITNWTANDRRVRFHVPVGVSYRSDPEQVREVLLSVAAQNPHVLQSPPPDVIFSGFADSALTFELRVWTITHVQTPNVLTSELYFAIFKTFGERGIEIPYPQRDLHLKSVAAPIPVFSRGSAPD